MSKKSLSDRYSPNEVEGKIYKKWEDNNCFSSSGDSKKPPYSVILPPPNVTGFLHIGHALDHSIQDVLVRWKRMSGYNVLWQPGTDHAGIATQSVVEKKLAKEGIKRQDMGREAFVEEVWKWKQEYGDRIVNQMKRLGNSCDWSRMKFTLDEDVSDAVKKVFVSLYKKGWIYKGQKLINWSPKLESAISDLEVEHKDKKGSLWHLKYPLADGSGELIVATTRPETMLGDTAVAVHPEDERYKDFIGKEIQLPLTGRKIPVIADSYVDKEFGSGAVKITPAHDFNDYEMGKRHNLEMINLLNPNGTFNSEAGVYAGKNSAQVRKQIVEDLETQGFLVKEEPHTMSVGHCEKTGCVVEPYLSAQWFVKTDELSIPAKRVVESGTTVFEPKSWTKTYLHWMNIIEDWCISRQLWWGHRIPAWYCSDCDHVTVTEGECSSCEGCGSERVEQETDVLDTWFSSALWPFSTLGWPNKQDEGYLKTFYPTNVLVTGHDIIFFWVARMMMMGLEFKEDIPFRKVYIHGLVRDSKGIKMSKSLGNSIDPVEIIESHGADALRFTLLSQVSSGRDLKFSEQRLDGYKNFMNKVWNATRFCLSNLEDFNPESEPPSLGELSDADRWIISKLKECQKEIDHNLSQMRFSDATRVIYSFIWHELCDWYLEFSKSAIYGENESEKKATQYVLAHVLDRAIRLLHPFCPFITEEIYEKLPVKQDSFVMLSDYPTEKSDGEFLSLGSEEKADEMDLVREVIMAIRNIRGENRIKPSEKINASLIPSDGKAQKILGENKDFIMNLSKLETCQVVTDVNRAKSAVSKVSIKDWSVEVVIPLEGLVDFDEEIRRINKAIEKISKETLSLTKRLNNENFVKNAPADVVDAGKKTLSDLVSKKESLEASLSRLQ